MMAEKVAVILTSQKNWNEWIEVIKSMMIASDIWNLVNPDTTNPPTLEEPQTPKPTNVNPQKLIFSKLDEDEKKELCELWHEHKRKLNLYDWQKQALATLWIHTQQTVSCLNLFYIFNCEIVHNMLVKLQKQFNPTDESRERDVIQRYQKLRKALRDQAIEPWLQDWDKTYDDCKRLQLPDTEGNQAIRDFIYAVNKNKPGFTSHWWNQLLDNPKKNFDLHEIIQKFREYQWNTPEQEEVEHSAFHAIYQGQGADHEKK